MKRKASSTGPCTYPMRGVFLFLILIAGSFALAQDIPPNASTGSVFAGTSPCGTVIRPLHGIAATAPCDQLKWRLTLYEDAQTHTPTVFVLTSEAAYFVDNRTTKTIGSRKITGTWAISQGTKADPAAVVYKLNGDKPGQSLSLLRIHPALLHPLNSGSSLLVGTAGASYTLSKVN